MNMKAEGNFEEIKKQNKVKKVEEEFVLPAPGNPWTVVEVWHAPSVWACAPDEAAYRAWSKLS